MHLAPRSASAQNTLGTILDALGLGGRRPGGLRRRRRARPRPRWALNNLCYLEFRTGRLAEARLHCEAALQATRLLAAHNNLALTHAAAGDLVRRAGVPRGRRRGRRRLQHRDRASRAGRYDAAAQAFEEAIRARPAFTAAKSGRTQARMRALQCRRPENAMTTTVTGIQPARSDMPPGADDLPRKRGSASTCSSSCRSRRCTSPAS